MTVEGLPWCVVVIASLIGAITDIRKGLIPNILTIPLFFGGLIWATFQGGFSGLGFAFAGSIILALPYIILFLAAGGGAGDAKMMGAIGAWVGFEQGIMVLLFVAIASIFFGILTAFFKKRLKEVFANLYIGVYTFFIVLFSGKSKEYLGKDSHPEKPQGQVAMPFGVSIFAGVCAAGGYWLL
jgi:Flp pilus assembly protein protease CpaA